MGVEECQRGGNGKWANCGKRGSGSERAGLQSSSSSSTYNGNLGSAIDRGCEV